jgi:phage RecT family recombinase
MNKTTTKQDIWGQLEASGARFTSLGLNSNKLTQFISLAKIELATLFKKFDKAEHGAVVKEYIELASVLARFNILPDPINQKAYILPFSKDKTKRLSLQIGYKAYIGFAVKSGYGLNTQIIYENDIYDINLGANTINHKPSLINRGEPIAVYTIASKGNDINIELMTKDDLNEVKANAFTGKGSPWGNFEGEMWKKICLKRCIKRLELSGTDIELVNMVDDKLGYGDDNIKVVDEVLETIQQPELNNIQQQEQQQEQQTQEEEGEF